MCLDKKCILVDEVTREAWLVVIEVEFVVLTEVNPAEILLDISLMSGVDADNLKIGVETDDSGIPVRVHAIVNDEQSATTIMSCVKAVVDETKSAPNDFWRSVTSVRLVVKEKELLSGSISPDDRMSSILMLSLLAVAIVSLTIL